MTPPAAVATTPQLPRSTEDRRTARCTFCNGARRPDGTYRRTVLLVEGSMRKNIPCPCTLAGDHGRTGGLVERKVNPHAKHGRKGRTPKGYMSAPGRPQRIPRRVFSAA